MTAAGLRVAPAVAAALAAGRPVVALETTLVTHGLPQPEGLAVAAELERVRAAFKTAEGDWRAARSELAREVKRLRADRADLCARLGVPVPD